MNKWSAVKMLQAITSMMATARAKNQTKEEIVWHKSLGMILLS